ncbi:MAG: hypothetical protein R3Y56_03495 [Akkermansia sp.]
MNKTLSYVMAGLFLGSACTVISPLAHAQDGPEIETLSDLSAYQLNVVYFLGSDREPIEGYQERISELLLFGQEFYGMEMQRNGFGFRSFGLEQTGPESINILVYKAKNPAADYPYSNGGGSRAAEEVNAWLDAEPHRRKSQHTLIIFPTLYDEEYDDSNPGGVPFYGLGRSCCALDYKDFDIKHLGQDSRKGLLLTKWYGGLLHELGHGLNLPHNHASTSEEESLGTALMGAGNHSFAQRPTFLTEASCAILDACEVFSPQKSPRFYQDHVNNLLIDNISANYTAAGINLSITYQSDELKSVIAYVEESPTGVNANYEAVGFVALPEGKSRVQLNLPWEEMAHIQKEDCILRVRFVMNDGSYTERQMEFKRDQEGAFDVSNKNQH